VARKLAVIGAGLMGSGIAQVSAQAGWDVVLRDVTDEALKRGTDGIKTSYDKFVSKGKLEAHDADAALGRILEAVAREGGIALVTADHGNAEEMLDEDGNPQTAHTSNPVPLVVTDAGVFLREDGGLKDLVPTAISLLGLAKPLQMTGHNLLVGAH